MEQASQTIGFTPDALWVTLGVLIALCAIALLVMNLVKTWRDLRKPKVEQGKTVNEMLASDNKRLNDLEELTAEQGKELKLILRSELSILHHLIDGNGVDGMKQTQRDIEKFLITGKLDNL